MAHSLANGTASLDGSVQKLRDAGYRITNARLTVLKVLHDMGGHLTSADVLAEVQVRDPSVGRASVFRTLDMLTGLSIVRPTFLNPRTPTYVLMSRDGHHSHIICTHCGIVIELDSCQVDGLTGKLESQHDIRFSGHLLEFYGRCEKCAGHNGK